MESRNNFILKLAKEFGADDFGGGLFYLMIPNGNVRVLFIFQAVEGQGNTVGNHLVWLVELAISPPQFAPGPFALVNLNTSSAEQHTTVIQLI